MTDEQRAELKRLAEAARDEVGVIPGPTRMAFIAAANPSAVLDLLAEREEDQGVIRVWRGRCERAEALVEEAKCLHAKDHDERKALLTENERLKAKVENIRNAAGSYFEQHGAEHEDGCPEDDTCECPLVCALNEALR